MAEMTDETAFGRLIVDKKLCTPDELQACRRHQKELELEGKRLTLQELMVKAGYLTRTQLQRLEQDMEDSMYRPVQQIPGFQILGRLGVGAMAKVFKARQLSLEYAPVELGIVAAGGKVADVDEQLDAVTAKCAHERLERAGGMADGVHGPAGALGFGPESHLREKQALFGCHRPLALCGPAMPSRLPSAAPCRQRRRALQSAEAFHPNGARGASVAPLGRVGRI